nr:uncharacterized protein LOC101237921 [Hydra vulgaris]
MLNDSYKKLGSEGTQASLEELLRLIEERLRLIEEKLDVIDTKVTLKEKNYYGKNEDDEITEITEITEVTETTEVTEDNEDNEVVYDLEENPNIYEGIEKYEFHEFTSNINSNLNSGEIRIYVYDQDIFTLPSEAFLLFEGRLVKADGSAYANTDAITLTHNGIMHLFSQIRYELSYEEVESVDFSGQATTYKDTTSTADLVNNAGFSARQQYIIQMPTEKGSFEFSIPLKHIFGFCNDKNKVIYGIKQKLTLFFKIIENKFTLQLPFLSRQCGTKFVPQNTSFDWRLGIRTTKKPRYILVGFQTNREGNQEQNASLFDHCDLKNMWIELNEERYPASDYNLSFLNQQFSSAEYKDLYPLMFFDVSEQSEKIKSSKKVNIILKAEFNTPVPAGTKAFAVVISDRIAKLTYNVFGLRFEY